MELNLENSLTKKKLLTVATIDLLFTEQIFYHLLIKSPRSAH